MQGGPEGRREVPKQTPHAQQSASWWARKRGEGDDGREPRDAEEYSSVEATRQYFCGASKTVIGATFSRRRKARRTVGRFVAGVLRSNEPAFRALGMRVLVLSGRQDARLRKGATLRLLPTLVRIAAVDESLRNQFLAARVIGASFRLLAPPPLSSAAGAFSAVAGESDHGGWVATLGAHCILHLFKRAFWSPRARGAFDGPRFASCASNANRLKTRILTLSAFGPFLDVPEAPQKCATHRWVDETFLVVLRSGAESVGRDLGAHGNACIGYLGLDAEWKIPRRGSVTSATMCWPWALSRRAKMMYLPPLGGPSSEADALPKRVPQSRPPQHPRVCKRFAFSYRTCDCCCWDQKGGLASNKGDAFRCRTLAAMYDDDLQMKGRIKNGRGGSAPECIWAHFECGMGSWLVQAHLLRMLARCVRDTPRNRSRIRPFLLYVRAMVDMVGMAAYQSMCPPRVHDQEQKLDANLSSSSQMPVAKPLEQLFASGACPATGARVRPSVGTDGINLSQRDPFASVPRDRCSPLHFSPPPEERLNSGHSKSARGPCLHPELSIALSEFVSKWYPQVPDDYISFLPDSRGGQCEAEGVRSPDLDPDETGRGSTVSAAGLESRSLSSGYIFRRKIVLEKARSSTRVDRSAGVHRELDARQQLPFLGGAMVIESGALCRHCNVHGGAVKERREPTTICVCGNAATNPDVRVASSGFGLVIASKLQALRRRCSPSLIRAEESAGGGGPCENHTTIPGQENWRFFVQGCGLSFHLRGRAVKFGGPSYRTALQLTNRSATKRSPFVLHVSPPNLFRAVPSFGVLGPQSSCTIVAEFTPSADDPDMASKRVCGFIRVRSEDGFALERVELVGYNIPLLRIYDSHIAFGFCPVNHVRSLPVYVENVGLVASNCAVHFQANVPFRVSPSQCLLQVGEVKRFEVLFEPRAECRVSGILVIRGMGIEAYEVEISGIGGQSLLVLDDSIDFGPTDVWDPQHRRRGSGGEKAMQTGGDTNVQQRMANQNVKALRLQNMGTRCELPIFFRASSNEIVVHDIIIQPGMKKEVPVELRPARAGVWSGSLTINAPNAEPTVVPLRSFVGPLVGFPVGPEVFFPCACPNETKTLRLPIINNSAHHVKFRICGHEVRW